jgi:hypothetical protein
VTCGSYLPDAETEIQVLTVHEEAFVKETDLIQGLAPEEHESANQAINLSLLVWVQISDVISREAWAVRVEPVQKQEVVKSHGRRRESTPAGLVQ